MSKQDTQGKPRRRRYAVTFKRELVERSLQPGASVSGIALDNGINANVLFRWRREQLHAASRMRQDHGGARAALLPVQLIAAAAPTQRATMTARSSLPEGAIEIDIGAARVRLHGAVDEANVRCVLRALKAIA